MADYASQAVFQQASFSGVDDNSSQIVETFSFSGLFANASAGDSWFFQPLFLAEYSVPEVSPQVRLLPLELGTPYQVKGTYRIELPADMRVASVPAKISLHSEFGSLEVTYSLENNALLAAETLSFTSSRIPPEKYGAFRDFVNAGLRVVKAASTPAP